MATYKSGEEFIMRHVQRVEQLMQYNYPFEQCVRDQLIRNYKRIFSMGLKTDMTKIGTYSTKPMYVNPNFTPRAGGFTSRSGGKMQGLLPTIGKHGEKYFNAKTKIRGARGTETGEPHRTTYLAGGYKELRNRTGRRIDFVNLQFTNDLFLDYTNAPIGTPPKPIKISQHEYIVKLKREHNVKKVDGLQKKYGTIFNLSENEKVAFIQRLQRLVNNWLDPENRPSSL
jgi:hypothetical protein